MTAERRPVRIAARWLARIDGVSGQIRLAMLGMTGLSTATLTLKQYGHGEFAWPLIVATGVIGVLYTYFYTEGGVWNQVSRDQTDMSDNYSGPTMLFDARIAARQRAEQTIAIIEDLNGEPVGEDRREELHDRFQEQTFEEWQQLREGMDMEELNS